MNENEFKVEIDRLKNVYGDKSYTTERLKIMWRQVKDFRADWFKKVIDELIGTCRLPPLMTELAEHVARERERVWKIEKEVNAQDAKEFMAGSRFSTEEQKHMFAMIRNRMPGNVNDDDWRCFQESMNHALSVEVLTPNKIGT